MISQPELFYHHQSMQAVVVTQAVIPEVELSSWTDSKVRRPGCTHMNHFYLARKAAGGSVCLFTHLRPAQNGQQDGDLLEASSVT